jgi:hypothetical protein
MHTVQGKATAQKFACGNPIAALIEASSVVREVAREQGYCYLVRNGQANFRDTAHISNVNASQYRGIRS